MADFDWTDLHAYAALPRLTGLAVSPDGTELCVTVSTTSPDGSTYTGSLWRVDPTGERPAHRLTRSAEGEAPVAYLADNSIAFTSKRPLSELRRISDADADRDKDADGNEPAEHPTGDDVAALWCLPADGGEPYELTRRSGGYTGVRAARTGDAVVLAVPVHVAAADEQADAAHRRARTKAKVTALLHEAGPVRYWDHDLTADRTRLYASTVRRDARPDDGPGLADTGLADADARLSTAADLTGPVGSAVEAWTTDAECRTVAVGWLHLIEHGAMRSSVELLDVDTDATTPVARRTLAGEDGVDFDSPVLSDDGTLLVCARQAFGTPARAADTTLWLVDVAGGKGRELAPDLDLYAHPFAISPDNTVVFCTADCDGEGPVFAIDIGDGTGADRVRRLTGHGAYTAAALSPDGSTVYALRSAYDDPGSVVAVPTDADLDDAAVGTVGVYSDDVRVLRGPVTYPRLPGRLERVETTTEDGARVPGWLVLPEGASAERPVTPVLWVHGGPVACWNSWSWRWCPWLLAAHDYAVLLPDPALSTGYGHAAVQRGWGRWGDLTYTDVLAFTDAMEARDDIDASTSAMMGGSFGGYMANWMAGHTDRFDAIVSHAGLWNLETFGGATDLPWFWSREMTPEMAATYSPHRSVADIRTPMLVVHGDRDYRVPIGEALALWSALCAQHEGDPAEMAHRFLYFPDENHWVLTPQHAVVWYETVLGFLAAHLRKEEFVRPSLV